VGIAAHLFKESIYFFGDRVSLPCTFRRADNKIIGEGADLAGVKQDNITGLLFRNGLSNPSGSLDGFQN